MNPFPEIYNSTKSVDNKENLKKDREYLLLFKAFTKLRSYLEDTAETIEVLEEIMSLRASFLIDHALTGLQIEFNKALSLLRNHNEFSTQREKQEREILVAAIDNLIDFAVAEEYSVMKEINDLPKRERELKANEIFDKYHLTYVPVENKDVIYSAVIASWWLSLTEDAWVTFMTQGDERVRAWHLSHEGLTYRKKDFPPELIPPLEFGCRCFLVSNSFGSVSGKIDFEKRAVDFNPVFKESLSKGGRIFTNSHPYFNNELPEVIKTIKDKLKRKFHLS